MLKLVETWDEASAPGRRGVKPTITGDGVNETQRDQSPKSESQAGQSPAERIDSRGAGVQCRGFRGCQSPGTSPLIDL